MSNRNQKHSADEHWTLTLPRRLLPRNFIADKAAEAVPFSVLTEINSIETGIMELSSAELKSWTDRFIPENETSFGFIQPKKKLEFYASSKALNISENDTVLDAAGGMFSCLKNIPCRKRYLQDISISPELKKIMEPPVECIQSDVSAIPLPDESVDKISCHHSFEHFQGKSDSLFIKEVQRLLKPGGVCSIIPVFIARKYIEMTDTWSMRYKFDRASRRIMDPTASLPGRHISGNYSRIYDIKSFSHRVLDMIDPDRAAASILELRVNGEKAPDLSLPEHETVTAINKPYRMLIIRKLRNSS